MKVQKLGWVLGMNMAVACMMMQGCKANKAGQPSPESATQVAVAPVETTTPVETPTVEATTPVTSTTGAGPSATVTPGAANTQPSGIVIEQGQPPAPVVKPQPSVTTVKPLPKPGQKPVAVAPVKGASVAGKPSAVAGASATAGSFVYTVKPGDQLGYISRRYNVRLSAIEKANPGLNPNRIRIGQKITIPGVAAPSAVAVNTVKPLPVAGTSRPTAEKSNTMMAAAPVPSATVAPAKTTAPVKTKPTFTPYVGATKEYTVKACDSLGKIAYENGITIRALKELNKLTKDSVRLGQKLLIPAEKVVKAAAPVAQKPTAKVEAATEKKAPAVTKVEAKPAEKKADEAQVPEKKDAVAPVVEQPKAPETVPAGEKKVPEVTPVIEQPKVPEVAPVEPKTPEVAPAADAAPAAGSTYTVKEGDDLVSISILYGISPSQLMDLNGIKAGEGLKAGQVLKIPAGAKPSAN